MPNINALADYFLPVMSKYTLIASIGLYWTSTCRIAMQTWMNAQNATRAMLHLLAD